MENKFYNALHNELQNTSDLNFAYALDNFLNCGISFNNKKEQFLQLTHLSDRLSESTEQDVYGEPLFNILKTTDTQLEIMMYYLGNLADKHYSDYQSVNQQYTELVDFQLTPEGADYTEEIASRKNFLLNQKQVIAEQEDNFFVLRNELLEYLRYANSTPNTEEYGPVVSETVLIPGTTQTINRIVYDDNNPKHKAFMSALRKKALYLLEAQSNPNYAYEYKARVVYGLGQIPTENQDQAEE